jgi:hypothetical protein
MPETNETDPFVEPKAENDIPKVENEPLPDLPVSTAVEQPGASVAFARENEIAHEEIRRAIMLTEKLFPPKKTLESLRLYTSPRDPTATPMVSKSDKNQFQTISEALASNEMTPDDISKAALVAKKLAQAALTETADSIKTDKASLHRLLGNTEAGRLADQVLTRAIEHVTAKKESLESGFRNWSVDPIRQLEIQTFKELAGLVERKQQPGIQIESPTEIFRRLSGIDPVMSAEEAEKERERFGYEKEREYEKIRTPYHIDADFWADRDARSGHAVDSSHERSGASDGKDSTSTDGTA